MAWITQKIFQLKKILGDMEIGKQRNHEIFTFIFIFT